jgi:CBS domain-containing protein
MQVKEMMAKKVFTVNPNDSVALAAQTMQEKNVGCLVVVNSGKVKGMITDRDLTVSCLSNSHAASGCQVSSHMSSPVITITPETDVLEAAHTMTARKVKRLPVVEGEKLVGLISMGDIAQAMDRPIHDLLTGMRSARRAS